MIIDIHTHTYPEEIAKKAINRLSELVDIKNYTDGTLSSLVNSQKENKIDCSVLLPVVTKPAQTPTVNAIAKEINSNTTDNGLISFAGIHPDNENYKAILDEVSDNSFAGIKLHPMFQSTCISAPAYLHIIDYAVSKGLLVMIHGGGDINYPNDNFADPKYTANMLNELGHPSGIIVAHMGGWHCWESALEYLTGYNLFFDTSSCLTPMLTHEGKEASGKYRTPLDYSLFIQMVEAFGADHILFGSDSPWGGQSESLDALKKSGLNPSDLKLILGENAAGLLHLK